MMTRGRREVVRMLTSSFFNQKATPIHSKKFCSFDDEEEGEGNLNDDDLLGMRLGGVGGKAHSVFFLLIFFARTS